MYSYPVYIGGQRSDRVDHDEMLAGKGVDETATISLSQHMQYTGLVQVYQVDNVFHFIQTLGVCLGGRRGGEGGKRGEGGEEKEQQGEEEMRKGMREKKREVKGWEGKGM